ncbi:peptide-methionine (S)-S-oxide reductase MsrA [Cohnella nanjingensis]|uniref:Peptide methionine sulfoxide reductase MsrA n=1 Tax=Cohnella nanjingensis TaxID=1387779 RepID=A0A7X0RRQ0_9BACL|nr:peptide-methionine (S)-S-oxide reductase MsrA [Cohnella nanjingensis]MBB6672422.1 peptide-methionine (S)-S-oxide reductase MsrA [Cohnella nanjingensis]
MKKIDPNIQLATFAGGCFWCMVNPFDELPGIVSVTSGYTGGHKEDPTYEEVGAETTGHAEAVQIAFDPAVFPYGRLLEIFWMQIDPTDASGQFQDRGASYRTAIFFHDEDQRRAAEASKRALQASGRFKGTIATEIIPAGPFYPAEDVHQHYYKSNPFDYQRYLEGSGRADFAQRSWHSKEDERRLRRQLTETQYAVTQLGETEPAYDNAYWDHFRPGVYVDAVNGDPLFSSADKFDSGTGWPSFAKPLEEGLIRRTAELGSGRPRTAIRSRLSGSRLGYLRYDGPEPVKLHYVVNSASLRFVPLDQMELEGYGRYVAALLAADETAPEPGQASATESEPKPGTNPASVPTPK